MDELFYTASTFLSSRDEEPPVWQPIQKKTLFAAMCTLKQGTKDCCL